MSDLRIVVEGESYLSLEAVSECYDCGTAWLRDAYDFGLLGGGRLHRGDLFLHVTVLDRVAEVWRLHHYEGLAFEAILVVLARSPRDPATRTPRDSAW